MKQFNYLLLLRCRETITVKTVTLCKKLDFFHGKSKKQKNEAGTNFVLLCQSRNMVGQFKKNYLHRPITILQNLTSARIQKYLT